MIPIMNSKNHQDRSTCSVRRPENLASHSGKQTETGYSCAIPRDKGKDMFR